MSHGASNIFETLGEQNFDFYKCGKCGRLVTSPEMEAALGTAGSGHPCPCGSLKYSPCNLPWWGWLLPRVLWFAAKRVAGAA